MSGLLLTTPFGRHFTLPEHGCQELSQIASRPGYGNLVHLLNFVSKYLVIYFIQQLLSKKQAKVYYTSVSGINLSF